MTYDPYRDELPPPESGDEYRAEDSTAAGAAILLGVLLLAAIGGFVYFFSATGDPRIATNDMRPPITQPSTTGAAPAPETTGSSANMPPLTEPMAEPRVKPVE